MLQIIRCAYFLPEHMHWILVHLQSVYVAQTLEKNGFRVSCSGKEASDCKMFENRICQQKYMLQFILLWKQFHQASLLVSLMQAPNYFAELFLLERHCFKYHGCQ